VDAIWISRSSRSPMKDFGYDVSDYRDVDPMFGTLGDFDALVTGPMSWHLKVMIDLVLSTPPTSIPGSVESRFEPRQPKSDWYVWADPSPMAARPTTGCRSSAARPGNGTASGCSTTCTTSSPRSRI
jgi:alpha-glucosidase